MGLFCSKIEKNPLEKEIIKNFGFDVNKLHYRQKVTANPLCLNGKRYILS